MEVKRSDLPDSEEEKRDASLTPADPLPPLVNFLEYFSLNLNLFKYGFLNPNHFSKSLCEIRCPSDRPRISSGLRTSEI
jgi:hypothetical protein